MNRSPSSRVALLAATLTVGLTVPGCVAVNERTGGASPVAGPGPAVSGTLNSAGASTQPAPFQAWSARFSAAHPEVTVNYDPVGSGGGRKQFLEGGVPLAGSDAALDDEELERARERCDGGSAMDLPVYVSPIALAYNLPGTPDLTLSPVTVARIFDQQVTDWSDPAIAADNGGAALPAGAITVVNRSDDSGTTENLIAYLVANAPDDFPHEVTDTWPVAGGEAAKGTSGVVDAIKAGEGSIGYADESQVGDLGRAEVVAAGQAVGPTAEAAAKVVDVSEPVPGRPEGDLAIEVNRTPEEAGVYPIVLVSYQIACTTYATQQEADLVKAFIGYTSSQQGQKDAADIAGSAPLSPERSDAIAAALGSITASS